jgi:hypothetical protein
MQSVLPCGSGWVADIRYGRGAENAERVVEFQGQDCVLATLGPRSAIGAPWWEKGDRSQDIFENHRVAVK